MFGWCSLEPRKNFSSCDSSCVTRNSTASFGVASGDFHPAICSFNFGLLSHFTGCGNEHPYSVYFFPPIWNIFFRCISSLVTSFPICRFLIYFISPHAETIWFSLSFALAWNEDFMICYTQYRQIPIQILTTPLLCFSKLNMRNASTSKNADWYPWTILLST